MSCYETHKGILKKVDTDNVNWYLFDLTNDNEILNEDCIITDFMYDNNLEDKYIIINNSILLNLIICNGMYTNYHKFAIIFIKSIAQIPLNIGVTLD